ncbi:MFS transporter [Pseudonocardia xinjiangensis]|uniref:MFS transporter n=1 Tax=Pseudonocardia xinjiangensis TaxID=75289 RepID=UPI003D8F6F60
MRSPHRFAALLGLLFGLAGTSTSAVTVALPELAGDLEVSAATAAWMVSGYTVTLAVATPIHGRLADVVGIRLPLCLGIAAMALGALAAALAPSFPALLVARVLQGAGAAAIPVLATALISARWSGSEQGAALGRVAGVAATIGALGPLLGGGLDTLGGWRWAVAIPVLALLAIPPLWRIAPAGGSGDAIDRTGAVLVAVAAAGLVLLIQSPSSGTGTAVLGAALLVVGAPLVTLWVRAHPHGFLPREIITNPTVLRSAFAAAAVPASWFALLLGVPLAAASWGWTPLATGALLVPAAVVGFASPALARVLLARLGSRRSIALACPTAIVALLTAAAGGATESPVLLATAVVLVSAAFGVGQPAMIASVGAAVPGAQRGVALGIATLVFLTGASVGAALVGGLADVIGIPGAFCLLIALPVAGLVALLAGGPDRVAADAA